MTPKRYAWLIVYRRPKAPWRAERTRRVRGELLRFTPVKVVRVEVIGDFLPALQWARVRFRSGVETWAPFHRLATRRDRFFVLWRRFASATVVAAMTGMTGRTGVGAETLKR